VGTGELVTTEPQEVSDGRIYEDLKAYADAGMLEYVLPTEPLGEQWIVGWRGQILKFTTKEGITGFLTGIQAGALFAAEVRNGSVIPRIPEDVR
jgi:hypothetical protein